MKQSLRNDRWQPLQLGQPGNYSSIAVQDRWQQQRDQWLNVRHLGLLRVQERSEEPEARQIFPSAQISSNPNDQTRKLVRKTMKSVQGPYQGFENHYPLEQCIDLYVEIWQDSDSSDS